MHREWLSEQVKLDLLRSSGASFTIAGRLRSILPSHSESAFDSRVAQMHIRESGAPLG